MIKYKFFEDNDVDVLNKKVDDWLKKNKNIIIVKEELKYHGTQRRTYMLFMIKYKGGQNVCN